MSICVPRKSQQQCPVIFLREGMVGVNSHTVIRVCTNPVASSSSCSGSLCNLTRVAESSIHTLVSPGAHPALSGR